MSRSPPHPATLRAARADSFPALGDTVAATWRDGSEARRSFQGFTYRCMVWKRWPRRPAERLPFDELHSLRLANGRAIASDELAGADVERRLPSRELLLLLKGDVDHYLHTRHGPASITSDRGPAAGDTLACLV